MTALWEAPNSVAGQKEVWKPSGDIWNQFQPSRVFIKGEGTQMILINWDYIYKKGGKQQGVNHKWSRNSHWSHHGNTLGIMNFMGGERERIGSVRRAADSYSVVSLLSCCFWNRLPDHKPMPVHRVQTTADAVVHPLPLLLPEISR